MRRNVYLTEEQYEGMRRLALELGVTGQRDIQGELPKGISPICQHIANLMVSEPRKMVALLQTVNQSIESGDIATVYTKEVEQ